MKISLQMIRVLQLIELEIKYRMGRHIVITKKIHRSVGWGLEAGGQLEKNYPSAID